MVFLQDLALLMLKNLLGSGYHDGWYHRLRLEQAGAQPSGLAANADHPRPPQVAG